MFVSQQHLLNFFYAASFLEMYKYLPSWFQILIKAVCISLHTDVLLKGIKSSLLCPVRNE